MLSFFVSSYPALEKVLAVPSSHVFKAIHLDMNECCVASSTRPRVFKHMHVHYFIIPIRCEICLSEVRSAQPMYWLFHDAGPSREARDKGHFTDHFLGEASDGTRYRGVVSAKGDPGYKATAMMVRAPVL